MTEAAQNQGQSAANSWKFARWLNVLPALLAVAAFFPIIDHDFIWDDVPLIVRNNPVHDLQFLDRSWKSDF